MKAKISVLSVLIFCFVLSFTSSAQAQTERVVVEENEDGWRLLVDDEPLMVNGMNWDYFPIGTNFDYNFWSESPDFIQQALDNEMGMLQHMGVNAIRVYIGIPKQWIEYIYDNYGIYTMLNHSFGRYGLTIDGVWMPNTEYSDPRVQELLMQEVTTLVEEYKGTRGLLLYLLGNENNYGLFWEGAETENIPMEDRASTIRARHMYELFNNAAVAMKEIDGDRPIAIANGDLLFLDLITELAPDIDIFGANVYRGLSFTDLYDRVKNEYGKPVLLTEFGADAFNTKTNQEDQLCQARYNMHNWKEIYEYAAGFGKAENSIGGFTFQFTDGWWKTGQTVELDIHNTEASWANGGYMCDYVEGENNMNEEWFGIVAKGPTNEAGFYDLFPRAAYYVLRDVHMFGPYANGTTLTDLEEHFNGISLAGSVLQARGDKAAMQSERNSIITLSRFTANFSTFNTGGDLLTTPDKADSSADVKVEVEFNIPGNIAQNPIDEIFYENHGRSAELMGTNNNVTVGGTFKGPPSNQIPSLRR